MNGSVKPSRLADDVPADVNMGWLTALWRRNQTWRDRLAQRAAHKALDIPEEEVIHTERHGLGWPELLVIAVMLLGTAAIAGWAATSWSAAQRPGPPAAAPADSEYEVRFFDARGNPIEVPPVSRPSLVPSP